MPSKGSWTSLRSGPCELHEVQQVQVQGTAPGSGWSETWAQTERRTHWEQPCREGFVGSGGGKAWHEPVVRASSPESCINRGVASRSREVIDPWLGFLLVSWLLGFFVCLFLWGHKEIQNLCYYRNDPCMQASSFWSYCCQFSGFKHQPHFRIYGIPRWDL